MKVVFPLRRLSRWLAVAGLAVGLIPTTASHAQNRPSSNIQIYDTPSQGPIEAVQTYKLGPGDVLKIYVQGYPDYSIESLVVPPDGKIILPVLGEFTANGKTTAKLQEEMRKRLGKRMRDPKRLSLSIRSLRDAASGFVYVIGNVKQPGQVPIRDNYRITEVISAVGGLGGRASEMSAQLARVGRPPVDLDLHQILSHPGDGKLNVHVKAGDVLVVETENLGSISINGDVAKPGVYDLRRVPEGDKFEIPANARLLDAIVAAGSLTPSQRGSESAVPEKLTGYILRQGQRIELRVDDAMQYNDPSANVPLQAGDFLTITRQLPLTVYVNGLVKKPGSISIDPGSGVVEAITQAGGLSTPIEKIKATVTRGDRTLPVDLTSAILQGDMNANLKLLAGDILQLNELDVIRIQVTGKVKSPTDDDALRIPRGSRLMNAISQAGGLDLNPDETRIAVLRRTKDGSQLVLNIDTVALMEQNDISQNTLLQDGDLISVTGIKTNKVTVSGEVLKPGPIELRETDGLASLIARAGGPTPEASLSQVIVQRDSKDFHVDAYEAYKLGKPLDFPLQDGDFIVVPENKQKVFVLEAVNRPGEYAIPEREKLTVIQALGLAGGTRTGAKTKEILLLRPQPSGQGEPEKLVISLSNIGKNKDALQAANTEVRNGDYIVVPEGNVSGSFTQKAISYIGLLSGLRIFF